MAVSVERSIGYRLNHTTSNTAFAGFQIYHRRVCKTLFSDLVEVEKRNAWRFCQWFQWNEMSAAHDYDLYFQRPNEKFLNNIVFKLSSNDSGLSGYSLIGTNFWTIYLNEVIMIRDCLAILSLALMVSYRSTFLDLRVVRSVTGVFRFVSSCIVY